MRLKRKNIPNKEINNCKCVPTAWLCVAINSVEKHQVVVLQRSLSSKIICQLQHLDIMVDTTRLYVYTVVPCGF